MLAARDQAAANVYLQALGLELESLLLQLNAAVDGLLPVLAIQLKGSAVTPDYTRESRNTWLKHLEKQMGFKAAELDGWKEVEVTRIDSNLVKHRLGLEFVSGRDTPLALNQVVQLTESTVLTRLLGIRRWLLEVVDRCKSLDHPRGAA